MLGERDTAVSLLANLGDFPYIFRRVYSIHTMPKLAARAIHGRYQSRARACVCVGGGGGHNSGQFMYVCASQYFETNPICLAFDKKQPIHILDFTKKLTFSWRKPAKCKCEN